MTPFRFFLATVAAWAALSACLATFPNFKWLFPGIGFLPFQQSYAVLVAAFLAIVAGMRFMPEGGGPASPNLSPGWARFWLFSFLAATAAMRLYHANMAEGAYWCDGAIEIKDILNIADFKEYSFIMPWGGREPFFSYLGAVVRHLLPDASALFIQRFSLTLIDMATVWICYLLGKEVKGRRVGVLLAALVSISKPMILMDLVGSRPTCMGLGVSLALLFFFRLLRKPDMAHFLQWSVAVSFGIYGYSAYRPFVPFFIFAVLAWVLYSEKPRDLDAGGKVLAGGMAVSFLVYFLFFNGYWPQDGWLARTIAVSGLWFPGIVLAVLLILLGRFISNPHHQRNHSKLMGWAVGSFTCFFLTIAIMTNPLIINRLQNLSVSNGVFNWQFLESVFQKLCVTLRFLFIGGRDRSDFEIGGDAFYDYPSIVVIALGLASMVARPGWKKGTLVLAALVGVSTHVLSNDPHSGKTLGSVVPLLLLGSLGADRVWSAAEELPRGRWLGKVVLVFSLAFWGWSASVNFNRIYDQWAERCFRPDVVVAQQAIKDAKDYRIYLANFGDYKSDFCAGDTQAILLERQPVRVLFGSNPIDMKPGAQAKDVVVLLSATNQQGLEDLIRRQYPTAQWSEVYNPPQASEHTRVALRVQIPFDAISGNPEKKAAGANVKALFYRRNAPEQSWTRIYIFGHAGVRNSFIWWEDQATDLNAPHPGEEGAHIADYTGDLYVNHPDKYRILFKSSSYVILSIDGKKIFDVRPSGVPAKMGEKVISLEAGNHHVELITYIRNDQNVPEVSIIKKGDLGPGRVIWQASPL